MAAIANWQDQPDLGCSLRRAAGAHFVLQLHDELIYEVAREDVIEVAQMCLVGWTRSEGKGPGRRETTSDGLGLRV